MRVEAMNCIVTGCTNDAIHQIGIRLRRPGGTAIWAPETHAYVCDAHAVQGFSVQIVLTPNRSGEIETLVSSPPGGVVTRTTLITRHV